MCDPRGVLSLPSVVTTGFSSSRQTWKVVSSGLKQPPGVSYSDIFYIGGVFQFPVDGRMVLFFFILYYRLHTDFKLSTNFISLRVIVIFNLTLLTWDLSFGSPAISNALGNILYFNKTSWRWGKYRNGVYFKSHTEGLENTEEWRRKICCNFSGPEEDTSD